MLTQTITRELKNRPNCKTIEFSGWNKNGTFFFFGLSHTHPIRSVIARHCYAALHEWLMYLKICTDNTPFIRCEWFSARLSEMKTRWPINLFYLEVCWCCCRCGAERKRCGVCILYRYYLFANGLCILCLCNFGIRHADENGVRWIQLVRLLTQA